MKLQKLILLVVPCIAAAGCNKPYVPSAWLTKVPPAAHTRVDPLPVTEMNLTGGSDTYQRYCTSCHGEDAAGSTGRPSLRNARVRGESDGDIHWILENGSKNHGMPAWRSLGDKNLWQLVQYIRSLPLRPQG